MKDSVSIIIPAWHEEGTIVNTLNSLKNLNYNLKDCEVIVAASADDNTYEIAKKQDMPKFGRYLVLKQSPGGKNSALQQGIKKSKGEIIILLDADTLVDRDWLKEIIKPLVSGSYWCANGDWFHLKKSWLNKYFLIGKVWHKEILKQPSTSGGGGIAFKRELLDSIGINVLFNDKILAGVDHYFGEQLIKRGYKVCFAKNAKTRTYLNSTFKGFVHRESRWLHGYARLITKFRLAKIIALNLAIFSSFILSFCSNFFLLFFSIYLSYLLIQTIFSSIKFADVNFTLYFPIYFFLSFFERMIALIIFSKEILGLNKRRGIHFKGER